MMRLHFLAVLVLYCCCYVAAAGQQPNHRTKRGVSLVTVSPPEVCVLAGEEVKLGCSVEAAGDYTCRWRGSDGLDATVSAIREHQVQGWAAASGKGCDVVLKKALYGAGHHSSTTYTCQATAKKDGKSMESSLRVNVIHPPAIVPVGDDDNHQRERVKSVVSTAGAVTSVTVSTTRTTRLLCHAHDSTVLWMLAEKNITTNSTQTKLANGGVRSELRYQFSWDDSGRILQCCSQVCNQLFCQDTQLQLLFPARSFKASHLSDGGVEVKFCANPPPTAVEWSMVDSCDKDEHHQPIPLVSTDLNVTTTFTNKTDDIFLARLVLHDANSTMKRKHFILTVDHDEGVSTYCTSYSSKGLATGAIIGISVGVVASVTLFSLALFIYHKSRSENYMA